LWVWRLTDIDGGYESILICVYAWLKMVVHVLTGAEPANLAQASALA